jgi:hypothetical protein
MSFQKKRTNTCQIDDSMERNILLTEADVEERKKDKNEVHLSVAEIFSLILGEVCVLQNK